MRIAVENSGIDNDARDIEIDGKFKLHIKRTDCGYVVEALDCKGFSLGIEEWGIWDDDLPEWGEDS